MRVLLTGASGFLGRRVRRELRKNKHDVFCYDVRLGYNILYPDQIENTILNWKPDVIIHLAALADLNIFKQKPEVGYELNVVKGALETIKKFKPVLVLEFHNRNLTKKFGYTLKHLQDYVESLGYRSIGYMNKVDQIFVPE